MAKASPLRGAESVLAEHALAYPEAYEEFPWGHRAVKVKGKVFVFLYVEDSFLSMSAKLPVSGRHALAMPFASPTQYGLGKSGWVTARFKVSEDVPVDLLSEWIDESFRAIAPKKVLAKLEEVEEDGRNARDPDKGQKRRKKRVTK
jgi:predicted DNA-binding protein (MmcQ/YjbR family)